MKSLVFLAAAFLATAAPAADERPAPPKDKEPPKAAADNKNGLVKSYRDRLKATASSFWPGWAPEKLIDGDEMTSWFSDAGDAVAQGKKPWVMVTFPEDVTVARVTVLGNREPAWPDGFTVRTGLVELLDADGKQLWADEGKGAGERCDFEFRPEKPVKGVRSIRFRSLKDDGDKTDFKDVAVGEILAD